MNLAGRYSKLMNQLGPRNDPRDYFIAQDGLWRSELLPQGVTIDQAIKDGIW